MILTVRGFLRGERKLRMTMMKKKRLRNLIKDECWNKLKKIFLQEKDDRRKISKN